MYQNITRYPAESGGPGFITQQFTSYLRIE